MRLSDFNELHYITDISNVPSIMEKGILSYNRAKNIPHKSVAMIDVQKKREKKRIPGGKPLHDYVNLYFCARNPMLYKLLYEPSNQHGLQPRFKLCVLKISKEILSIKGVFITDGNAASDDTHFFPFPEGLDKIDESQVFAEYWKGSNEISWMNKKFMKCAEVLVPDIVDIRNILGAYVSCDPSRDFLEKEFSLVKKTPNLIITENSHLFFDAGYNTRRKLGNKLGGH